MTNDTDMQVQVTNLLNSYVEAVDGGNPVSVAKLFTPGGIYNVEGRICKGTNEIEKLLDDFSISVDKKLFGRLRHNVGSIAIHSISPNKATATSYFLALSTKLGPDHWGVYTDILIKTNDKWLFESRTVSVEGATPNGWIGSGSGPPGFHG
jgi:hypothetical protein